MFMICCCRRPIPNQKCLYRQLQMLCLEKNNKFQQAMKIHKVMILDQTSEAMENLSIKHKTTLGICGFITCAASTLIAKHGFDPLSIHQTINTHTLTPLIQDSMKFILARRKLEIQKYHIVSEVDKQKYLKEYVANYQISDYLEAKIGELPNKSVYFFRQSAYDYPQLASLLKYEEAQRTEAQEKIFKGKQHFFSSFGPYKNHEKEYFEYLLRKSDPSRPVVVATDVLGHYSTVVLFGGQLYVLDSLNPGMSMGYDQEIIECLERLYKKSYLVEGNLNEIY